MAPYTRNMNQTATYWPPGANDGFGGRVLGSPSLIQCRWQDNAQLFRDAEGREVTSSALVYTAEALDVRGYLALGDYVEEDAPTVEEMLATSPFMAALPHPGWMWEDTSGLTSVLEAGQPVRRMIEQGAHKFEGLASSDPRRPIYNTDGTHHWLEYTLDPQGLLFDFVQLHPFPMERVSGLNITSVGFFQHVFHSGPQNPGAQLGRGVSEELMTFVRRDVPPDFTELAVITPVPHGEDFVLEERFVPGTGSRFRANNNSYVVPEQPLAVHDMNRFNHFFVGSEHGSSDPAVMRWYGTLLYDVEQTDTVIGRAKTFISGLQPDGPLASASVLDPRTLPNAFEIRQAQQSPSLGAGLVLHKVFL